MIHYADLLIRVLPRGESGSCPVEVTYSGEQDFPRGTLDPEILGWQPTGVPEEDGARLFAALLGKDGNLRTAWDKACAMSEARRVRLYLDPAEPGLHALPWELMRDSAAPAPLAVDPKIPFSRHLPSEHGLGRPIFERPLRLLVAIANPPGLEEFGCDPLDVEQEKKTLSDALAGIPAGDLEVTFLDGPVTLPRLEEAMGRDPHILHLVVHGHFDETVGASLYFEAEEGGSVHPVGEEDLVRRVADRRDGLRLIFLASCESAKRSSADAFRGLAPKLVQAGIPAIVAMQSEVGIDDAGRFAAEFYRRLLREGVVDVAANQGRRALLDAESPHLGAPVVFQRLREGRLFGRRGEVKGEEASAFWGSLLDAVEEHNCVPILGPGLLEGLLPSPAELARDLKEKVKYPFPDSDDLPRVAQFGSASDSNLPRREVLKSLTSAFCRRYGRPAPEKKTRLSSAIHDADWLRLSMSRDESEVHRDLADLGLPLYLTTNFDSFMFEALKAPLEARERNPRRAALPWLEKDRGKEILSTLYDYTPDKPLILHLFGNDEDEKSMVVSEDDYLRYLCQVSCDHEILITSNLAAALATQRLLFIGYRLADLDLRVLLRGVLARLNCKDAPLSIAVQVDPQQSDESEVCNVRQYMEDYFANYRIIGFRIYWGTARQFVAELHDQWEKRRHA